MVADCSINVANVYCHDVIFEALWQKHQLTSLPVTMDLNISDRGRLHP
jgi:hypothetical protein